MRALLIGMDDVEEIDIEQDPRTGSCRESLSNAVGGRLIEAFMPLYGPEVTLYVNEESRITEGCKPNRAVYANRRMAEAGYLSTIGGPSYRSPERYRTVREGELYAVLYGPIVAIGFDPETGEDLPLTDEQAEAVKRDFGENAPMGPYSGLGALEMLRFARMISRM